MNNLLELEKLAQILNEPFDLEGDLYYLLIEKLSSAEGVLVPFGLKNDEARLNYIDDISQIKIRNNLLNIPISNQENLLNEVVEKNNQIYIKLRSNKQNKSTPREIAEIIENFYLTPLELKQNLQQELSSKLKNGFVKLLSEKKIDLAKERLLLLNIKIQKQFDFYTLNYDNLNVEFEIYNIYNLKYLVDNFFENISNQELLNPPLDYLFKIIEIKENLEKTNIWLAK